MVATASQLSTWASRLPQFAQQSFPDAVARGLNRTAEEAQARMRLQLYLSFTIRRGNTAQWFEKMIKIRREERASARQLWTMVRLDGTAAGGPAAQARARAMLWRQETGGTFNPPVMQVGGSYLQAFYLPAPGQRTSTTDIPRAMYPAALGLAARRNVDGSTKPGLAQGKRGTFVIPGVGIFQRQGNETDSIWLFVTRAITLKPRLKFQVTIDRVTRERVIPNIQGMIGVQLAIEARRLSGGRAVGVLSGAGFGA